MSGSSPSVRKPRGVSPWVVIALVIAALVAFGVGSPVLGVLLILALVGYMLVRPSGNAASRPGGLDDRVKFLEPRVAEIHVALDQLLAGRPVEPQPQPKPERAPAPATPPLMAGVKLTS